MKKTKLNSTKKNQGFGQIKFAFSFLEMSVVIVIIGILTSSMLYRNKMVSISRLESARSLTKSSPVPRISNLVAWYETTMRESFDPSGISDGNNVSNWYNLNPYKKSTNNASNDQKPYINAIQRNNLNKPKYTENAINNLPALYFMNGGSYTYNDHMLWDGSSLANSSYTIFMVEQRKNSPVTAGYFIGGYPLMNSTRSNYISNTNLRIGYQNAGDNSLTFGNLGTTEYYTLNDDNTRRSYGYNSNKIHCFYFKLGSNSNYVKYYLNDESIRDDSSYNFKALNSYERALIGANSNDGILLQEQSYNGYIGEIIVYNKALNIDEIKDVNKYLSQKWRIELCNQDYCSL